MLKTIKDKVIIVSLLIATMVGINSILAYAGNKKASYMSNQAFPTYKLSKEISIEIFKAIPAHCFEKGHEFVSSFQSVKNKGLLPSPKENYMGSLLKKPN